MTTSELDVSRVKGHTEAPDGAYVEACLDGGLMRVRAQGQARVCRKAVGCLIEPMTGDHVALYEDGDGISYVIAILERASSEPAKIRLDRSLSLETHGDLSLQAHGSGKLECGHGLQLQAEHSTFQAVRMDYIVTQMQALIGELGLTAGSTRCVAKTIDMVAEQLMQALGHSYRSVEGTEQLRAGHIDYAALEQLRLHGRHSLLTADQLAKIDAEQIHLG